jgi:hypothetical protein
MPPTPWVILVAVLLEHDYPHLAVISGLRGHMGATRFIEWQAKGAQLPPTWAEAMRRFRGR